MKLCTERKVGVSFLEFLRQEPVNEFLIKYLWILTSEFLAECHLGYKYLNRMGADPGFKL